MLKIALIGHDTRNPNLGVGALTVSDISILRSASERAGVPIQISVLIGEGRAPCCVSGDDVTEVFMRPLRKPWALFKILRAHDIVVDISGGDSFADIYGDRRMFQTLLQKYLVHFASRPLVMAPQTVGPFVKPLWRRLSAGSIKRCAIVCTRDAKSTAFLREIGYHGAAIEASDVALRLPFDAPEAAAADQQTTPKVGINVSGLLMGGGYTGKNEFGLKSDYPALIRDLITHFQTHADGCEVHLLGHVVPAQRGGVEDDYQACLNLQKDFPDVTVAPAFETPSEAKSYIAGLDFFMGARMHACIAAFSSGVPVVPMAYSRKFEGLFGTLGYHETVDCTSDSSDEIKTRIFAAYEDRAALQVRMAAALTEGREKLQRYEEALVALFSQTAAR